VAGTLPRSRRTGTTAAETFPTKISAEQWLIHPEADTLESDRIDPDAGLITFGVYATALNAPHPIHQIDGLSVRYEARVLEEGIEDMQGRATANFVDVILHIVGGNSVPVRK
jgi:hypothetical protein